jgi:DNA repair protein RecO (recombination protein O)
MNNLDPAFVLHTRPYQNTSLLVELFTESQGRITIVAKGAKRPKSSVAAIAQMFQPLLVETYGKSELLTLKYVEISHALPLFHPSKLAWGLYLNELLYRILERHEAYPDIFESYHKIIEQLAYEAAEEKHLRIFERDLLSALGYGLPLQHVAHSNDMITPEIYYHFLFDQGPTLTQLKEHPLVFKGQSLLELHQGSFSSSESLHDAKRLLRYALSHFLGNKPIKSRELVFGKHHAGK